LQAHEALGPGPSGVKGPPRRALGRSAALRLPPGAPAQAPRIAWRMVLESWLLLLALWQNVVLRRPVRGRWVSEPIDGSDTPEARGARIWAVLSGSMAPNRVVGGAEGGRVVVHELVRR